MADETSFDGEASPPINVNITPVAVLEDRRKKKKTAKTGLDMRDNGLFVEVEGDWLHVVAPHFDIVARTSSITDAGCGLVLQFKGERSGKPKDVEIHKSDLLLGRGLPLCAQLANEGLHFLDPAYIPRFIKYLSQAAPAELRMVAGPPGWTKDGDFALPDAIYGKDKTVTLVRVHGINKYRTNGSLPDWQENVAALAVGNWRSVVQISTSFAGPLLKLLGIEGFVFHTPGLSSKGKTTSLQAAASVWGFPDKGEEGNIIFGSSTSNSLEGVAERCSDTGGYLDEIGLIPLKELHAAVFKLSEGTGKTRLTQAAVLREPRHWDSIFQTSGNDSISSLMREASPRQRASGGQAVRAIELPPVSDEGCFEALHGFHNPGAFAEHLRAMALMYYGVAGREFLARFVPKASAAREELARKVKDFAEQLCKAVKSDNGQVRRMAQKIALIAIAGELATAFGITGWGPKVAEDAAIIAFAGIIRQRGGTGDHEVEFGVRAVCEFIERGLMSRFVETRTSILLSSVSGEGRSHQPIIQKIAGHIIELVVGKAKERIFAFTTEGFEEACGGAASKDVAKELVRRKLLVADEGHFTKKVPLNDAEKGDRYRRYCVRGIILNDEENLDG